MTLLPDDTWASVKPIFQRAFPCEAIVAIFADGSWREIENLNARPWQAFTISATDSARLAVEEPTLFLHSHPNGQAWPSDMDTEQQLGTGWNWGIVPVTGNVAGDVYDVGYPAIWGPDAPISPLEGRSFLWGVQDCWTLAWDYYRLAGRDLPAIPRVKEPGGHHTEPRKVDPFRYWPPKLGFVRVDRADRQPGDLAVLTWSSPIPNHTAIYLGEAQYLHQPEKSLSHVWQVPNEEKWIERMAAEYWRLPDDN